MTRRAALAIMALPALSRQPAGRLRWRTLPPLPQALGGQFAGVSNDKLLVAGGSYFDTPPWDGGMKQRLDTVYALDHGGEAWKKVGKLPFPIASGAAASTPAGLLCTGGQLAGTSSKQCLQLSLRDGKLLVERMPDLPHTLSMHAAACDGANVYIAGGQETAGSTESLRVFWRLQLGDAKAGWKKLPDLPSPGRILPVLVAAKKEIYVISGAELTGTPGPPPGRRFLTDAHRYTDRNGWEKIGGPPRAVQGGEAVFSYGRLLIFSGNDGEYAAREYELRSRHPGFSKNVLCYSIESGEWTVAAQMPECLVTSGAAMWGAEFVIPGGEVRPAHRSATVLAGRFE